MIKRISLARRRRDLSVEEFAAHWLGPHAEIARQIPGIRGYLVNLIEDPEGDLGWDGIAETWFDTREEAISAFASEPVASLLAADRPRFLEEVRILFAEEHVVIPPLSWSSPQG